MINFVFFPGSYGYYLASCVALYSNLTDYNVKMPEFGLNGNSHPSNVYFNNQIKCSHFPVVERNNVNKFIFIKPNSDNQLDYLNNQFEKYFDRNLENHLKSLNFKNNSNTIWEKREIFSYWIEDFFNDAYSSFIKNINNQDCVVDVDDIFDNINEVLQKTLKYLSLKQNIDSKQIYNRHDDFLKKQKNHKIQQKILNWIESVIQGQNKESPCRTFFDEAYAQNQLRKRGYEIKCYNLDIFPKNSLHMQSLIY